MGNACGCIGREEKYSVGKIKKYDSIDIDYKSTGGTNKHSKGRHKSVTRKPSLSSSENTNDFSKLIELRNQTEEDVIDSPRPKPIEKSQTRDTIFERNIKKELDKLIKQVSRLKQSEFDELDDIDDGLKNKQEVDLQLNINFIMNLIEDLQDLEEKTGKEIDNCNIFLPFVHWQFVLGKRNTFEDVIDAVINPESRIQWDSDIKSINEIAKFNTNGSLLHTEYKYFNLIGSAEMYEKRLGFETTSAENLPIFISFVSPIQISEYSIQTLSHLGVTAFQLEADNTIVIDTFVRLDESVNHFNR